MTICLEEKLFIDKKKTVFQPVFACAPRVASCGQGDSITTCLRKIIQDKKRPSFNRSLPVPPRRLELLL